MHMSMALQLPWKRRLGALVNTPPFTMLPFMAQGHVIFPDNNILINADKAASRADPDDKTRFWRDQLNNPAMTLNPVLSALETPNRRTPTREEFRKSLDCALARCRTLFPQARLIDSTGFFARSDVYEEFIGYQMKWHDFDTELLLWLAPKVVNPLSQAARWRLAQQVLDCWRDHSSTETRLVLLVALATIFDRGGSAQKRPIASSIIKPKVKYSRQMAYSALADIRALDTLAMSAGITDPPVALCTGDIPLIRLWQSLKMSPVNEAGRQDARNVILTSALLPLLNDNERQRLCEMVKGRR